MTDTDLKELRKAADCAGLSQEFAEMESEINCLRACLYQMQEAAKKISDDKTPNATPGQRAIHGERR